MGFIVIAFSAVPFRESETPGNETSAGHGEELLQNTSQFLGFSGVTQSQPSRITMMKTKLTLFVTVLAAALFGVGCATVDKSIDNAKLKTFSNEVLEKAIRDAVGKPEGELTDVDYLRVRALTVKGKGINDISILSRCKNIAKLDLSYNNIEDLSPLSGLLKLRMLDLDSNHISDLSALSNLTELDELSLKETKIISVAPLSKLSNLRLLGLDRNPRFENLGGLGSLSSLRTLTFSETPVKDLSPLKGLSLTVLGASYTHVSNFDVLKNMRTLRSVDLYRSLASNEEAKELVKKFTAEAK